MNSKLKKWTLWVVVFAVWTGFGVFVSCKSGQEKMAEEATERMLEKATGKNAEVDIKGGKVEIKSKEGKTEISYMEKGWPADIPGDVPLFRYGKTAGVTRSTDGEIRSWMIVIQDIKDGSLNKYTEELKSKGWQSQASAQIGRGGMIHAAKGRLMLMVAFNGEDKTGTLRVIQNKE
ncbi:MAG: hypothetical protein WCC06_01255 [Candidatus Aminicenantales bacterium]